MEDLRYKSDKLRFNYINNWLKGKEILDIGSTEGNIHSMLVKSNPNLRFYTLDSEKGADFVMNLDKPKRIKRKFDTIIAGEIIEHLESPIQFIRYCKSILKRNGRIILTTPNAIGLQYLKNESWCVYYKNYRGHTQAFTIEMLKRIFSDEKFSLVNTDYINAFWISNPLQIIPHFIKKLRTDLLIVADKDR
jgi:2-polyprenyl-3-methyl-5-hydroxy-6-metoxy-1,4-benzoquinol methylase